MKPEQVTYTMRERAFSACMGSIYDNASMDAALAASLNAMPDDLLRELCKERGCVMVPQGDAQILVQTALNSGYAMDDAEIAEATNRTHELLAAAETPAKETNK